MVLLDIKIGQRAVPGWFRGFFPLRRRDHLKSYGDDPTASLTSVLADLVWERCGIRLDAEGKVFLLTGFGFLWHRFNPASFYYCYGRDGDLQCLVAEVTNTPWHEQSYYVLDAVEQGQHKNSSSHRQQQRWERRFSCVKDFHVSPFMPMDTRYRWLLKQEDDKLLINIAVDHNSQPIFNATLDLMEKPLNATALLAVLVRQPLMSLGVSLRIYWQALRLWLKSTPYFQHPRYSSGDK